MRETRKLPIDDITRAVPPTADRGELASIVTAIPPLTGVPFAVGRDATSLGDVGLPHPGSIAPNAPNMANAVACAQNPRRVCPLQSVSFIADLRGRLCNERTCSQQESKFIRYSSVRPSIESGPELCRVRQILVGRTCEFCSSRTNALRPA